MFVNDDNLILGQEVIDNVLTSDHAFNIISTSLNTRKCETKTTKPNIYSTKVSEYNLMNATKEEWNNVRKDIIDNYDNKKINTIFLPVCKTVFFMCCCVLFPIQFFLICGTK